MADDKKKFPDASDGIKAMFNLHDDETKNSNYTGVSSNNSGAVPSNLPFSDNPFLDESIVLAKPAEEIKAELESPQHEQEIEENKPPITENILQTMPYETLETSNEATNPFPKTIFDSKPVKVIFSVVPYLLVFGIGLGLYAFYFSDFSVNDLFNKDRLKIEGIVGVSENKDLIKLKEQEAAAYQKWIGQFFFDVNDEQITSMETDVSGNGLTNFEKYLLNLNPKVYSTRGSLGDGESILQNVNPWTGKALTDAQKELIEKYINKELVSNRITAAVLTRGVTKFAQFVNEDSPYYISPQVMEDMRRNNVVITPVTIPSSENPEVVANQNSAGTATQNNQPGNIGIPTSQAQNLNDGQAIDQSKPGLLEIPANGISVPLIWTQNVSDFDADLKKGIVHYPGTVMPGEMGTSYISGHSSGYAWDRSPYKQIFAALGGVADGTSFSITATRKNGQQIKFHYIVERRGEFAANDQAQFVNTADSVVALSTCWPVGTTDRRLVLFAKLTQVEK